MKLAVRPSDLRPTFSLVSETGREPGLKAGLLTERPCSPAPRLTPQRSQGSFQNQLFRIQCLSLCSDKTVHGGLVKTMEIHAYASPGLFVLTAKAIKRLEELERVSLSCHEEVA